MTFQSFLIDASSQDVICQNDMIIGKYITLRFQSIYQRNEMISQYVIKFGVNLGLKNRNKAIICPFTDEITMVYVTSHHNGINIIVYFV